MDEIEAMLRPIIGTEEKQEFIFPLTAVVGHQEAKRGIILSLINPGLSLIIYGDRGLGKKTMLMAASNFLPDIESTGCPFNCDPHNTVLMCTDCKKGGWMPRPVKRPFVILPYTVNTDMLIGSGDPYSSILGSANRGILAIRDMENYSDEMIEGIFSALKSRKLEVDGYTYPTFFQPIATYNDIPGEIRDRFILKVRVDEVQDIEERIEILRRVELFRKDPQGFYDSYGKEEQRLNRRISDARAMLRKVGMPAKVSTMIKNRISEYGLKGEYERRLIVAATANAAYEGRLAVSEEDVREVMRMVLPRSDHKG